MNFSLNTLIAKAAAAVYIDGIQISEFISLEDGSVRADTGDESDDPDLFTFPDQVVVIDEAGNGMVAAVTGEEFAFYFDGFAAP